MCANIDRKLCGVDEGLECKAIGWMSARRKRYDPEQDREHLTANTSARPEVLGS